MVRKTGFILSAVFLVLFIFVGCSTIPLDEGKRYEGVVTIDYHFNAQGTTTDGLGVKLSWDIIPLARRYRVIMQDSSSNTLVDTVFVSYELSGSDTAYNNNWTLAQAEQLGTFTVLYSNESSGGNWSTDTVGKSRTATLSGSSYLIAYGLNGKFAAMWDEDSFSAIGWENTQLHSIAEVYLYDPCDSMNRIDTTAFAVDTSFTVDTLTNDTSWIYDTTVVADSAVSYLLINSAYNPPFLGSKQAGVLNVGQDSSWGDLRVAPMGDQYLYTTPLVTNDIIWMQSVDGRYMKIRIDSIYTSPPVSDLDSAVIYFHWNYQRVPKFRYVY